MGYMEDVARVRGERDSFLAQHYASPLPEEDQDHFTGIEYFDPDPGWRLTGTFRPPDSQQVDVPSSSGASHPYGHLGTVVITIGDASHALVVLDDGDGNAFIPFADPTNGVETYGGGRYVDLTVAPDGVAIVDFNQARNPYCAYDEEFICPLPPASNRIDTRVEAGEKRYVPGAQHP